MAFKEGERLKTLEEYKTEVSTIWDKVTGYTPITLGSHVDVILNVLAKKMWNQQNDYHTYVLGLFQQSVYRSNRSGCSHDFKDYVGLTESYKYCTKCGDKESK